MVQDIIQFTRLADVTPARRGNLALRFSSGTNCLVMFYWLVSIHKLLHVILSEAKNLCGPCNYEILRRPAPAGLLRMTPINAVSEWTLFIY